MRVSKMGKKRKFIEVFKSSKCQNCGGSGNENCQQCGQCEKQEPAIVQPAKRSLLHQILRHGFNVQTKASSQKPSNPPAQSSTTTTATPQKPNGLLQHFKIAKFKDGLNYIKGKEVETLLEVSKHEQIEADITSMDVSNSQCKESIADTMDSQSMTLTTGSGSNNDVFQSSILEVEVSMCQSEQFPPLKPLFFEVPTSPDSIFIGRTWLFSQIEIILQNQKGQGIIIRGNEGCGKTSTLLQLVENSCFGRRSQPNEGTPLSLLASKLVAYHFCQVDYRTTCLVPEFVHSIAAQLCQAPQLSCFRDYLVENSNVQSFLTKLHCLINPDEAFCKGIIEPLNHLYKSGEIPETSTFLLVIDSICEAEAHRTDTGGTISTFLAKHIEEIPNWLKIIITARSGNPRDIVSCFPFQEISLSGELQSKDLSEYISVRIRSSRGIRANVSGTSTGGLKRFQRYLQRIANGNFLFLKLLLDFIEQGSLQIKSSNFKVLPHTLSELFQSECSLQFPTRQAFANVEPILSTCLAALNPLNILEIYHSINSLHSSENIPWEDFVESVQSLANFLTPRSDGTYMFFHASFRDWLMQRDEKSDSIQENQFLCDTSLGHAAISYRLSRIEAPLTPDKTLELGHHILQAHIYKGIQAKNRHSIASKDLQAFWLASSAQDLSKTLATTSNIYYPNIKVSRLLLIAGASPNQVTDLYRMAPILSVAAAEGNLELLSLLLDFGADVDAVNLEGDTALHLACQKGHLDIVSLLVKYGGSLNQLNNEAQCPFVKAVLNSKLEILIHLLEKMEDPSPAVRRALLAICLQPEIGPELDILDKFMKEFHINLDSPDGICGETPLTAAVRSGREEVVRIILSRGGNPGGTNLNGIPPLNLAAKGGHCSIVKALLASGCSLDTTDSHKRTPLIEAAANGQFGVVDLLVLQGAEINSEDEEGLNALSWACYRGQVAIAQYLLGFGADPNHADKIGRTPLDLASSFGSEEIAQLLLDHGALLERADVHGNRPLDRAVANGHLGLVKFFLKSGAKMNLTTWTLSNGKHDIIYELLAKILEDGLILCKSGRLREAVQRFQYALRRIPLVEEGGELQDAFKNQRINVLLQLSRCKRILKEPVDAVSLASESIKLDPMSYKTWFARAKAYLCLRAVAESLQDCSRAIELATKEDVKKRLQIFKEDIKRDCRRSFSPCQFSTNSLRLFVHTTTSTTNCTTQTAMHQNQNGGGVGMRPKASTSNCLSARKSIVVAV